MEIKDWRATADLNDIYREIRELGIETNLAELEAFGFTIIEDALSPSVTEELKGAILRIGEERLGKPLDPDGETDYAGMQFIPYLLFKDPVFKHSVMNPKPLALVTYLLGKHAVLSSLGCHLKGPGGFGLPLHSDQSNGIPQPFAPASQVANCNYALTDYTEDTGSLAVVPGSHRHLRQPTRLESALEGEYRNPNVVAIEVPAGAAIVWHGATWHGSFPRQTPGLRINLSNYFCRPHLLPQEDYRHTIPDGWLGDAEPRWRTLLNCDQAYGWTDDGLTKPLAPQYNWHA